MADRTSAASASSLEPLARISLRGGMHWVSTWEHLSWPASGHHRMAAGSYLEAKLFYSTYYLAPFSGYLCSGFGPINASLWRLTLVVITCFLDQISHSRHLPIFFFIPAPLSRTTEHLLVMLQQEPAHIGHKRPTEVTLVFSLNFHELEILFWNIIHIQQVEINTDFDCQSSKTWLEYYKFSLLK